MIKITKVQKALGSHVRKASNSATAKLKVGDKVYVVIGTGNLTAYLATVLEIYKFHNDNYRAISVKMSAKGSSDWEMEFSDRGLAEAINLYKNSVNSGKIKAGFTGKVNA
jgi:hypothetical protein